LNGWNGRYFYTLYNIHLILLDLKWDCWSRYVSGNFTDSTTYLKSYFSTRIHLSNIISGPILLNLKCGLWSKYISGSLIQINDELNTLLKIFLSPEYIFSWKFSAYVQQSYFIWRCNINIKTLSYFWTIILPLQIKRSQNIVSLDIIKI